MRWIVVVTVWWAIGSAGAWAGDIFTWTDADGSVHYSNSGAPDEGRRITVAAPDSAPDGAAGATREAAVSDNDAAAFSTQASLRRTALERSLRDTERSLADVDGQLATIGRLRGQHARGSAATGGVGGDPTVESDEEHDLRVQRKSIADQYATLQGEYAKLRGEVTARLGETPAWWIDYRPRR